MNYVEVAVSAPVPRRGPFTYSLPPGLDAGVGHLVWVPFGPRTVQGIVVGLTSQPQVDETRDVLDLSEAVPLLEQWQVELGKWTSEHYLAPLFDSLAMMLPPGAERGTVAFLALAPNPPPLSLPSPAHGLVLELVRRRGKASLAEVEEMLGKEKASRVTAGLVRAGFLLRKQELEGVKVKPRVGEFVELCVSAATALEQAAELRSRKGAVRQAAALELLAAAGDMPLAGVRSGAGASRAALESLVRRGLLRLVRRDMVRDPLARRAFAVHPSPALTGEQEAAWQELLAALRSPDTAGHVFLLHGVTGSGKTELYLRALAEVVSRGKRGIVLVPEISLTAQTIERFASRFPGRVAVLHSGLTMGERYDEWWRIKRGEFDVVVGARSAVFAPQPDLGLVVVDEEHEWSYKQQEMAPRYHARDVALRLAELRGAVVVLGSATPDVETYYRGREGRYRLLRLAHRITPWGVAPMPRVEVVDMRRELKTGNRSIFSSSLLEALSSTLAKGEQAVLFLNRRGSATVVMCRSCGYVARCRRCEVSLTYHSEGEDMVCHLCGRRYPLPVVCPGCMSRAIRFLGTGTERVESLVRETFPQARTLRWDRDTSRGGAGDEAILREFLSGRADVLIGTQMIAKGLDMPAVTLVGVINADVGLHLPDFRAGERTFQLLCQVVGRAGRGPAEGKAIIQTYSPEHYSVRAAASQDFPGFYEREIGFRRRLSLPPFARLVRLVYSHSNEEACREEVKSMKEALATAAAEQGMPLEVVGPAPCLVGRLRGRFRWQLVLRGKEAASLVADTYMRQGWTVDVEPVSVA